MDPSYCVADADTRDLALRRRTSMTAVATAGLEAAA